MSERFSSMKSDLRLSITCGKSAIHGLGAIAKRHLRAGRHEAPLHKQHTRLLTPFCIPRCPFSSLPSFPLAGDMVIDYVGELVRQSVAEAREKVLYNQLVGCGTYVFT